MVVTAWRKNGGDSERKKTLTLGDFLRRDNIIFEFFPHMKLQKKEKLPAEQGEGENPHKMVVWR